MSINDFWNMQQFFLYDINNETNFPKMMFESPVKSKTANIFIKILLLPLYDEKEDDVFFLHITCLMKNSICMNMNKSFKYLKCMMKYKYVSMQIDIFWIHQC